MPPSDLPEWAHDFDSSDVRAIPLTRGYVAIVDADDYERVSAVKWSADARKNTIYVRSKAGSQKVYLHRFILNAPAGCEVDHQNHNGLDNRKQNLRVTTQSGNQANRRKRPGTSSQYKGVSYARARCCYEAYIKSAGKRMFIGHFSREDEAARAYDAKARELFGEFAHLNFPVGSEARS